jgi:hypothetical protein
VIGSEALSRWEPFNAAARRRPKVLGNRDSALGRDECGDPRIDGQFGHIYAVPGGFQIVFLGTARPWGYAKKAMSFAKVTHDGDEEGCLFLAGLPTESGAEAIRDKVGIPKKREERGRADQASRIRRCERVRAPGTAFAGRPPPR